MISAITHADKIIIVTVLSFLLIAYLEKTWIKIEPKTCMMLYSLQGMIHSIVSVYTDTDETVDGSWAESDIAGDEHLAAIYAPEPTTVHNSDYAW